MSRAALGLCAYTHDSSASLVVDGVVAGVYEEDRLSGEKHTRRFPSRAVERLLSTHGLHTDDVTAVGYNFSGAAFGRGMTIAIPRTRHCTLERAVTRVSGHVGVLRNYLGRMRELKRRFRYAQVHGVPHHLTHCMAAAVWAGWARCAVLSVDSIGEGRTTTIGTWDGNACTTHWSAWDTDSLGYAYGAVTEHLGYRRGDEEGTVMALAALGDPARFRTAMSEAIVLLPRGFKVDPKSFLPRTFSRTDERLGPRLASFVPARLPHEAPTSLHADLAAALQERTTDALIHLARLAAKTTNERRLCVTGGVAMNCVAAGRVVESGTFDDVFIPPSPGDGGSSLGAALNVWYRHWKTPAAMQPSDPFVGPKWSRAEVQRALKAANRRYRRVVAPAETVASAIADGGVVGVFLGPAEAGPRALGHRSILASPLAPRVTERLAVEVKKREAFRPFAPAMLADHVSDWLYASAPSPFMSFAFRARPGLIQRAPAIVHVDGSVRVQTLRPGSFLYEVVQEFYRRTGFPAVINTSLNVKGHPTAGTPEAALACFDECGLNALLLGDCWLV